MDIILFFISNKKHYEVCHYAFMPYRKCSDVKKLFEAVLKKGYHEKYPTYMKHVNHCVGILFRLEKEESKIGMKQDGSIHGEENHIDELVEELLESISLNFKFPPEQITKLILTRKFQEILKSNSTHHQHADWKMKKQEILDEVLADLLNGK
mmetsp:Transcript_2520/g.2386  ORF Transcript_2520/g.2386 Transcript_2520/m.2386 type:complete len:152 (-) Transcript_2520:65-520(-)